MTACGALVIPGWLVSPVLGAGPWADAERQANRTVANQSARRIVCLVNLKFIVLLFSRAPSLELGHFLLNRRYEGGARSVNQAAALLDQNRINIA